jgi:hypothetical protein
MSKKSLWQMSLNSKNEKSVSALFIDKGTMQQQILLLVF